MAIKKNDGRQEVILAQVSFTLGSTGDVAAQGTFPAIQLPQGAVVVGGYLKVTTATSASVTIALNDGTNTYLTATSAAATGRTAITPTGAALTAQTDVNVVVAGATPVTAGEAEVVIEYFVKGRAEWTQG